MPGKKVKVERVNKKGRTEAVEKALRALGAMKQGDIQAKYPTKGTRMKQGQPVRSTAAERKELSELRPPARDPGAVERMMKFEESAREQGFAAGGSVCAGGRSAIRGKKFSGTF